MESPAIQIEALFLCHQIEGINMADRNKPDKIEQPILNSKSHNSIGCCNEIMGLATRKPL